MSLQKDRLLYSPLPLADHHMPEVNDLFLRRGQQYQTVPGAELAVFGAQLGKNTSHLPPPMLAGQAIQYLSSHPNILEATFQGLQHQIIPNISYIPTERPDIRFLTKFSIELALRGLELVGPAIPVQQGNATRESLMAIQGALFLHDFLRRSPFDRHPEDPLITEI